VQEVLGHYSSTSDRALAWSLFQQVQESMLAENKGEKPSSCIARSESNDTDFVNSEMQSRAEGDVERVDFIVYEDGESGAEIYIESSEPGVAGLVLYVRERSGTCIAFDVQIRVSEEGGF
jgi:hypothetical protein